MNKAVSDPGVREKLQQQGAEIVNISTEDFVKFVQEDTKRWTEIINSKQIKVN